MGLAWTCEMLYERYGISFTCSALHCSVQERNPQSTRSFAKVGPQLISKPTGFLMSRPLMYPCRLLNRMLFAQRKLVDVICSAGDLQVAVSQPQAHVMLVQLFCILHSCRMQCYDSSKYDEPPLNDVSKIVLSSSMNLEGV
jgi:hypothetical protein